MFSSFSVERKEARKRQKQRQKDAERGVGSADVGEMAADDDLLAAPETAKPEQPADFDETKARQEVMMHIACLLAALPLSVVARSRRGPGRAGAYLGKPNCSLSSS
jgi:hypothetical protein